MTDERGSMEAEMVDEGLTNEAKLTDEGMEIGGRDGGRGLGKIDRVER